MQLEWQLEWQVNPGSLLLSGLLWLTKKQSAVALRAVHDEFSPLLLLPYVQRLLSELVWAFGPSILPIVKAVTIGEIFLMKVATKAALFVPILDLAQASMFCRNS